MDVPVEQLISESKIFARLDDEGRQRLTKIATEQTFEPGQVVLREGEPGDAFYFVLEGAVTVDAATFDDSDRHLATLTPGSVVGEIASLTREPRTATVTAQTATRLLRFEMVSVFAVLKDYPEALADLNRLGLERTEDLLSKMSD